jgi:Holliday junction resolvasome RuvABC endonuclease subunit
MKSIGIDPGSHKAGVAVVEDNSLLYSGLILGIPEKAKWEDTESPQYLLDFQFQVGELIQEYEPDILVVELCSVPTNMHTNKMLAYWEAAAILAAEMSYVPVKRMRTSQARKKALGTGTVQKDLIIKKINKVLQSNIQEENEAEAAVFALAGVKYLGENKDILPVGS